MWELHPKTVYAWIREGKLPAIKTPGAQYRVRSDDARAYCEKNGLPMTRALASPAGAVAAIGRPGPAMRALAKACKARGTRFASWTSALEGLLAVAGETPDVLVIDAKCDDVKVAHALRALKKTASTANLAVVVLERDTTGEDAVEAVLGALEGATIGNGARRGRG